MAYFAYEGIFISFVDLWMLLVAYLPVRGMVIEFHSVFALYLPIDQLHVTQSEFRHLLIASYLMSRLLRNVHAL